MTSYKMPAFITPAPYFTKTESNYDKCVRMHITQSTPWQWETDLIILHVLSGHGSIIINGMLFPLGTGSVCRLEFVHIFRIIPDDCSLEIEFIIMPYQIVGHMGYWQCDEATADLSYRSSGYLQPTLSEQKLIGALFERYKAMTEKPDCQPVIHYALLTQLNALTLEISGRCASAKLSVSRPFQILIYIHAQCTTPLHPDAVASLFHVSVSQLNADCRRITGLSFNQILNRARAYTAATGILLDGISTQILAKRAGFSSPNSLYREFKRYIGATPQDYRSRILCANNRQWHPISDKAIAIILYLLTNCREQITITDCQNSLFLSADQINTVLQNEYGSNATFQKELIRLRLEFAHAFLSVSTLPVCDIAINAGFNSSHTLIRLFKDRYGMTPSKYRESLRQQHGQDGSSV